MRLSWSIGAIICWSVANLAFDGTIPLAQSAEVPRSWREELEDVVALDRLREFSLLLAREAYAANAAALSNQIAKRSIAALYQAYVELEMGNLASAHQFAELSHDPRATDLRRVIASANPARPWNARALATAELFAAESVALDDLPDVSRDVVYAFYDPSHFREYVLQQTRQLQSKLPRAPSANDTAEWILVSVWCHVLAEDWKSAADLLGDQETAPADWPSLQGAEWTALSLIVAEATGKSDIQHQRGGALRALPSVNVWALRAWQRSLSESTAAGIVARREIRWSLRGFANGPFDPRLVQCHTVEERARLSNQLDLYWELAWNIRCQHVASTVRQIPLQPPLSAVRASSLALALANPQLRHDWDLLRIVMLAELRALERDLQMWQLELHNDWFARVPPLYATFALARAVAGRIDIPATDNSSLNGVEAFSEEVEFLLLGQADEQQSSAASVIPTTIIPQMPAALPAPAHKTHRQGAGVSWGGLLAVAGGVMLLVAGGLLLATRERPENSP